MDLARSADMEVNAKTSREASRAVRASAEGLPTW